jgi:hypothetical protein
MMEFLSDKRPIIECKIGGKPAAFLLDTGASVAFIDREFINEYALAEGKRYHGSIVGAGGEMRGVRYCNSFVTLPNGKDVAQFLLADISNVRESIEAETGIDIVGIISWPQMKMVGITLNNK